MKRDIFGRMKLYLFDMDGTLYLGDRLFGFTAALLSAIRETGGKYLFLTNNSSKSVSEYVQKLARLGIAAGEEDFLTSTQATAWYLRGHGLGKRLYVCGTASMAAELSREGFEPVSDPDGAECVVVGFDTELTYRKLSQTCQLLRARPDIPYLATNPDLVCPVEEGFIPDCGSICACIESATGRKPLVIGKPSPLMPLLAMERFGTPKEQTCVVGDRLYTDIKCGLNAGIFSVLVLSGETTPDILAASPDRPDLVLEDGGEILKALTQRA